MRPLLIFCALLLTATLSAAEPVRIFFDTDMETDCDDAAALGLLHVLANQKECQILATVVSVRDPNSAATVDAINRAYGRPALPVGMVKGTEGVLEKSAYAAKIAAEFPNRFLPGVEVPDAVAIYRDVLQKQPDHSVTIVTVGYLTNLRHLLALPAGGEHPSGRDLIRAKVVRWVCMGGNFIGDPPHDDLKLGNVNFQRDAASALAVIPHWPGEVNFAGREVCSVPSGVTLGTGLAKLPATHPVRRAYEFYFGGKLKNRHVADIATVLYAVRGARDYWDVSTPGTMDLHPDMTFDWKPSPEGKQTYLKKKEPKNDREIEKVLEELLVGK